MNLATSSSIDADVDKEFIIGVSEENLYKKK